MLTLRRSLLTGVILLVAASGTAVAQSRAWLGIALACTRCSWMTSGAKEVWQFSQSPVIEGVDSTGPAARAGMRPGDIVLMIDGLALTSTAGARRLADAEPDQKLLVTYDRDGVTRTIPVIAAERPAPEPLAAAGRASSGATTASRDGRDGTVRFSGALGDMIVTVQGSPDVHVVEQQGKCGGLILTPTHRIELTCSRPR